MWKTVSAERGMKTLYRYSVTSGDYKNMKIINKNFLMYRPVLEKLQGFRFFPNSGKFTNLSLFKTPTPTRFVKILTACLGLDGRLHK